MARGFSQGWWDNRGGTKFFFEIFMGRVVTKRAAVETGSRFRYEGWPLRGKDFPRSSSKKSRKVPKAVRIPS